MLVFRKPVHTMKSAVVMIEKPGQNLEYPLDLMSLTSVAGVEVAFVGSPQRCQ